MTLAVAAMPGPGSRHYPEPVVWETCHEPRYRSTANRWWGGFTACQGDVEVDIEADSIQLRGPDLRVTIRTPSCPAGRGAGGGSVDRSIFARPFAAQLAEIKRIVTRSLAGIDEACGGRTEAPALLGPQFDEKFRELASRYWLELSAADRRKSWALPTFGSRL